MVNIIMFGAPGSGKGTQSELLQERFNLIHLSTGDVCREEIKQKTPEGLEAKRLIDGGDFFSDELAYRIVEKFLDQNSKAKGIVYDGIPRHIGQTERFDQMLAERQGEVDLVIELKVDEEVLIDRLLKRGELSGRADDRGRDVILKRLRIYDELTVPIADYYKKKNLYFTVDGMGSFSEVAERIATLVEKVYLSK